MEQRRKVTAAELLAKLHSDPEWLDEQAKLEQTFDARSAELQAAEAPLVNELRSLGLEVGSVWDLVNSADPYPAALPLLLDHLGRDYPSAIREGIARALAVPQAGFARDALIRAFKTEEESRVKDGLAVAVAETTDPSSFDDLVSLLMDRQNGGSRLLLLSALERSTDPRVEAVLAQLAEDPELSQELTALRRRRTRRHDGGRPQHSQISESRKAAR